MDLVVLPENRFPLVRVRGRGDSILYFIFVALEVQGSEKKNIDWRIPAAGGGTRTLFLTATSLKPSLSLPPSTPALRFSKSYCFFFRFLHLQTV